MLYRLTRYDWNHCKIGPIQNDLTRIQNYNSKTVDDLTIALVPIETWLQENWHELWRKKKERIKKWLKIPRRRKIWSRNRKINYDAVETSSKNLNTSRKSSTRSTSDSTLCTWLMQCKKELQCLCIVQNIIVRSPFRSRNPKDSACNTSNHSGYVKLLSVPMFLVNLRWMDSILSTSQW